jgi:hypothetical protein
VFTIIPTVKPSYLYEASKYVLAALSAAERLTPVYGPYLASPGPVVFASILSLKLIAIDVFINFIML